MLNNKYLLYVNTFSETASQESESGRIQSEAHCFAFELLREDLLKTPAISVPSCAASSSDKDAAAAAYHADAAASLRAGVVGPADG